MEYVNIKNEAGVLNAKRGRLNGGIYVFTHWNPKTNKVFAEREYTNESLPCGFWIDKNKVCFID